MIENWNKAWLPVVYDSTLENMEHYKITKNTDNNKIVNQRKKLQSKKLIKKINENKFN